MRTRPLILFHFLRNRREDTAPLCAETPGYIHCRITVSGKKYTFATGLLTTYGEWSVEAHRLRGKSVASKQANEALTKLEDRLNDLAADLDRQGKPITAKRLYQLYKTLQTERGRARATALVCRLPKRAGVARWC